MSGVSLATALPGQLLLLPYNTCHSKIGMIFFDFTPTNKLSDSLAPRLCVTSFVDPAAQRVSDKATQKSLIS